MDNIIRAMGFALGVFALLAGMVSLATPNTTDKALGPFVIIFGIFTLFSAYFYSNSKIAKFFVVVFVGSALAIHVLSKIWKLL